MSVFSLYLKLISIKTKHNVQSNLLLLANNKTKVIIRTMTGRVCGLNSNSNFTLKVSSWSICGK